MSDFLQPLGPDAIRQRIAQIQSQMGQRNPESTADFAGSLQGSLQGGIGPGGTTLTGSTAPFDPMAAGGLTGKLAPADLKSKIVNAAKANGVDPNLLDAIVQAESSYDTNCVSKVGAKGLTQLMPETAQSMGVTNPFDPDQNLNGGAKYLSSLLKQFPNIPEAVAAYNAGPGAVIRHGGIPNYPETQAYVQRVMGLYRGNKG